MAKILFLILFCITSLFCLDIPLDRSVISGSLQNGLCYFIRENSYPENNVCLRLVVKVGSIYEEEEEKGVAHFVEHLVFRGSEHFKDTEIFTYLSSLGAEEGADANAFTSFDSTVYVFDIPANDEKSLQTGLCILKDIASSALFEKEAIDLERNVVLDELHQTLSSAEYRYLEEAISHILPVSPYNGHFPIGKQEVIETISQERLKAFYKKWYRPDRMAVIAVGDFDKQEVQKKIEEMFSSLSTPQESVTEPSREIQYQKNKKAIVHFDPELTSNELELLCLFSLDEDNLSDEEIVKRGLFSFAESIMLNNRLNKAFKNDPACLHVMVDEGDFIDGLQYLSVHAELHQDHTKEGIEALHVELQKALQFGFSESEWRVALNQIKHHLNTYLDNIDKTTHQDYIENLIHHYLNGYALFEEKELYSLFLNWIEQVKVEEINAFLPTTHFKDQFLICFKTASQDVLESINEELLSQAFSKELPGLLPSYLPVTDELCFEPFFEQGRIEKEEDNSLVTTWTLSNGIKVILKPTDLETGSFKIFAVANGGLSSFGEEDYSSACLIPEYCYYSGGVTGLKQADLEDLCRSQGIDLSFRIQTNLRSLLVSCKKANMEAAFQLLYGLFTSPSLDPSKWNQLLLKREELARQLENDPNYRFSLFVNRYNTQNHYLFDTLRLDQVDEKKTRALFKQFYGNPHDFSFIVVGDFTLDQIRSFVEKYLSCLPKEEKSIFQSLPLPSLFPKESKEFEFKCGHNAFVTTKMTIPFDLDDAKQIVPYTASALESILTQRLTNCLRKELGSTYSVDASFQFPFYPLFHNCFTQITFTSQKESSQFMVEQIFKALDELKQAPPKEEELLTAKAQMMEKRRKQMRGNHFWIEALSKAECLNEPIEDFGSFEKKIQAITEKTIWEAAQVIFSSPYHSVIYHLPEELK